MIVYCSPQKTAGMAFSEVILECVPVSRVRKEAYPLELGVNDVADILGVAIAEVCCLISNNQIGARFLNEFNRDYSNVRVRAYDLIVYIKNKYGDEDNRFKVLEEFLNDLVDAECDDLIKSDFNDVVSDSVVSNFGIGHNSFNAMMTKIVNLKQENAEIEAKILNNPSLIRFGKTIDVALDVLFSEYAKSMDDSGYRKITRQEYLTLVSQKMGDVKVHVSLANRIFDCYPKEHRAGPGKVSR